MDLTHRLRITLAGAIALLAAGSIVYADGVEAGNPQLLPDLRTLKPPSSDPLRLHQGKPGKATLRIANEIGNLGAGPLELYAEAATDTDGPDCTPGEYPDDNDRDANQRIWEDTNGNGEWDGADEVGDSPKVGCFEWHPAHSHWHFQDFSVYTLRDRETDAIVAGPSRKIGFCIVDTFRVPRDLPGSPSVGAYPGGDNGCGGPDPENPEGPPLPVGTMGLSIGWTDLYTSFTAGQKLVVSGVEPGRYCLTSTANPQHDESDLAQIIESNPDNNSRRRLIKLDRSQDLVKDLGRGCPPPGP
jgi:hypothetical protein